MWSDRIVHGADSLCRECMQPGERFDGSTAHVAWREEARGRLPHECVWCGRSDERLQVDHILPKSRFPGLALEPRNAQRVCAWCNQRKMTHAALAFTDVEAIRRWILRRVGN